MLTRLPLATAVSVCSCQVSAVVTHPWPRPKRRSQVRGRCSQAEGGTFPRRFRGRDALGDVHVENQGGRTDGCPGGVLTRDARCDSAPRRGRFPGTSGRQTPSVYSRGPQGHRGGSRSTDTQVRRHSAKTKTCRIAGSCSRNANRFPREEGAQRLQR